ncbi:MAG TPA: hypothetical protein VG672_04155, partial [Bryobacteraceae bacterium]|nr:hypothetical protein [Bryobacteraceae bacterium]
GFDFRASLGPGTLAHLDFARMLSPVSPRFLRTLDLSQSAPLEIRAVAPPASFPRVDLQFQSPAVAVDLNQGAQRASLAAGAAASLTLVDRGTARSLPVLDRLVVAAGGFRRHVNGALDAFAGEAEPLESVRWKADFGGTGKPVLSLQGDGLELALRSRIDRLAWLAGGRESSAAVSTSLEARLSLHGGHLIVDADTPVRASVALNGRPASTWDFRLPLLLALDEHLQPAAQGSGDLWDAAYYESLWRGYRPRHAITTGAWIDRGELLLGNLSFQEIVFPTAPFRLAAGYGEALELHVPLSARLLFGRSDALFQARLNWLPKAVAVDTRARLAFENVQAGGVGLAHAPGRVAFLEDTLDGSIQTRTDHLIVDSRFLPRFLADASSVTELDKIGVRLEVHSARDGLPGVLQAATDLNVHLYSDLLNSLAQQLRLEAPPRAIRYRRMGLHLQIADGEVATRPVLLDLEGVEIPGLSPIAPAQIRVHWGKERGGFAGSPLRFRNLLGFLQRSLGPPANE